MGNAISQSAGDRMPEEINSNRGKVFRVATNELAYLALDDQKTILSFTPFHVKGSDHKNFTELKVTEGSVFNVRWHPATTRIESAVQYREKLNAFPPVTSSTRISLTCRDLRFRK